MEATKSPSAGEPRAEQVCVLSLRGHPSITQPRAQTGSGNGIAPRWAASSNPSIGRRRPEHGHSARARPVAKCGKCDACHDASTRPFWSKRTRRMGYPSMGSNRTATDRTSGAASAQARRPRRRRDGRRAVLVKEVRRDAEGVGGFPSGRGTRGGAVSEPCSQDRSRLVASPALAASSRPSALGLSIDAPRNAR
jgi:hypothetical protein